MRFHKYHALGNDYLVLEAADVRADLTADQIRLICDRHRGVGADGILLGSAGNSKEPFSLRIFNPDGSEAEKSGNGLRIFARYLYDTRQLGGEQFSVLTKGGAVRCQVARGGQSVTVEMGRVSFHSQDIPVVGPPREVLNEEIMVLGKTVRCCAATIGNPHCVVLNAPVSKETACKYGPAIETDSRFPNRTNVQFMGVLDRANIRIEIWERGAGYTLASGSSSCAAAAVAHRLGLCDHQVTVYMPGGKLRINIGDDYFITMTGPVAKVCDGATSEELA